MFFVSFSCHNDELDEKQGDGGSIALKGTTSGRSRNSKKGVSCMHVVCGQQNNNMNTHNFLNEGITRHKDICFLFILAE